MTAFEESLTALLLKRAVKARDMFTQYTLSREAERPRLLEEIHVCVLDLADGLVRLQRLQQLVADMEREERLQREERERSAAE